MIKKSIILAMVGLFSSAAFSQEDTTKVKEQPAPIEKATDKKWYDIIKIQGAVQGRYNAYQENPAFGSENEFYLRRVRLKTKGDLNDYVSFYIQTDFTTAIDGDNGIATIKDAYFDLSVDRADEFRFRFGLSKVPYSYEILQSSQKRTALERSDAMTSAIPGERDLGVVFFYTPENIQKLLKKAGKIKGTGDYGMFSLGIFNGEGFSTDDPNGSLLVSSRLTYPFEVGNQLIEAGISAYTNKTTINISQGVIANANRKYLDQRAAASFVLYPQPFGIQAEYSVGKGPQYNSLTNTVEENSLEGGYATLSYATSVKGQELVPFARYEYYDGGDKADRDARSYKLNNWELGLEWSPIEDVEFVASYSIKSETTGNFNKPFNFQEGNGLTLQAQVNF